MQKQKLDANGLTEREFLSAYDVTKYFRPSVTVDAVLFCPRAHGGKILLIKRGGHPFIGKWAFPGGFVEAEEPCEVAAPRELAEETGIQNVPLAQLVTASKPDRDPRWRNITVVFYALIESVISAKGSDDAAEARWFDVSAIAEGDKVTVRFVGGDEIFDSTLIIKRDTLGRVDLNNSVITEPGGMAFDHAAITALLIDEHGGGL